MRRKMLNTLLGLLSFVGAIEIFERKRDVVGKPLQQLDQHGVNVFFSEAMNSSTPANRPALKSGSAAPALAR